MPQHTRQPMHTRESDKSIVRLKNQVGDSSSYRKKKQSEIISSSKANLL